jgi:DNA-directed RNA polymerase alpha subunit
LAAEGIKTVGELCARTAEELLEIRNFGGVCLREVMGKLEALGLRLSR